MNWATAGLPQSLLPRRVDPEAIQPLKLGGQAVQPDAVLAGYKRLDGDDFVKAFAELQRGVLEGPGIRVLVAAPALTASV